MLKTPIDRDELDRLTKQRIVRISDFYPESFLDLLRRKKAANDFVFSDCLKTANVFGTNRYKTFLDDEVNHHLRKMDDRLGLRTTYHSILRYKPGSFAKMHPDQKGTFTVVTLLEQHECDGGEMIVFDDHTMSIGDSYWSDDPKKLKENINSIDVHQEEKMHKIVIGNAVPVVMNFNHVGESVLYPAADSTLHGVARINSGERVVFIHWMDRGI